jgi:Holliday junction resolvase RusA-like endonuclease
MPVAVETRRALELALTPPRPMVEIYLAGQPRGKGRPRFGKRGNFVSVWTDPKTMAAEKALGDAGKRAMKGEPPREGPMSVSIVAAMEIPQSWPKKRRAAAIAGELHPTGKPDFDNMAKIVGDALNGIAWLDDAQIVACTFVKFYSLTPGLTIKVVDWA